MLEDASSSMKKRALTPHGASAKEFWSSLLFQMEDFLDRVDSERKRDIGDSSSAEVDGSSGHVSNDNAAAKTVRDGDEANQQNGGVNGTKGGAKSSVEKGKEQERKRLEKLQGIVGGISDTFPEIGRVIEEFRSDVRKRLDRLSIT